MVAGKEAHVGSEALDLVNRVMVDWVRVYRKIRVKENECPYYSPSSTMTSIRSLFAYFTKAYGWVICFEDLKGFDGCLDFVLSDLFKKNQETYVSLVLLIFVILMCCSHMCLHYRVRTTTGRGNTRFCRRGRHTKSMTVRDLTRMTLCSTWRRS